VVRKSSDGAHQQASKGIGNECGGTEDLTISVMMTSIPIPRSVGKLSLSYNSQAKKISKVFLFLMHLKCQSYFNREGIQSFLIMDVLHMISLTLAA
jgi:hypothetical protein